MSASGWPFVLAAVVLTAAAQLLLKAGAEKLAPMSPSVSGAFSFAMRIAIEPHLLGGVACYFISMLLWIMALTRMEVSVAYPMLSLGYVLTAIAAYFLFGEAVSVQRVLGIVIIIVGVVITARS